MEIDENAIRDIVANIVKETGDGLRSINSLGVIPGVFDDMNTAIYEAKKAHKVFSETSLEVRRAMIKAMRQVAEDNAEQFSRLAVDETGMGRYEHKIRKNQLAGRMTPGVEDLQPMSFSDDHGLTITERASYGVIGAIAPSTNPTETIINNSISMVSAGNTVVFNSHPGAKNVSVFTVKLLNEAILKAGGPANIIVTVKEPTIASGKEMMTHPLVDLLTVTGGPAVVGQAMQSTKKVIAAGPGNPPTVVDETADIEKAAKDIVAGTSFDNNIVCICEKEIIVVRSVADQLKTEMKKNGAFELTGDQIKAVSDLVIDRPGRKGDEGAIQKKYVGRDAHFIAAAAGVNVPEDAKILLCEVDKTHPLVWTEQLMPVIPLVRVDNVDEAIDFAVECEHGFRHSASMHSLNIAKLSKMARVINTSLFVKNGSNFNGMGFGGAGYTSFTIASPTGEGFTRARTFTRERRCAIIDHFRIV
ncbi:MAG: aldehyde dehydrogenase family protein [Spirochaetota bacterium]|nr:aldehyde dehydrogenase family protein [Spirochaetota bacterium]